LGLGFFLEEIWFLVSKAKKKKKANFCSFICRSSMIEYMGAWNDLWFLLAFILAVVVLKEYGLNFRWVPTWIASETNSLNECFVC